MEDFIKKATDLLTQAGGKIIVALLAFIVGKIIIGKVLKLLEKGKGLGKTDPTVRSFTLNFAKVLLYVILIVTIVGILGIPMSSIVAVLASAGVAVGLALQGALGNLVGGSSNSSNNSSPLGSLLGGLTGSSNSNSNNNSSLIGSLLGNLVGKKEGGGEEE